MQTCRAWMGVHLPHRNMYHKGIYPFVNKHITMPLMRLVVCFDGQISATVTVSSPSSSSAHPTPWLSCCSYFIYFHSLPRSVGSLRSRASRFLRGRFVLPLSPVFNLYNHSTGIQIPVPNIYFSLLLRSKDLDSPCTYYYVTPSQDHSTGCPTHMTFYPPHPPPPHPTLPFSPTTGTVLGFEYPFKISTSKCE